MALETRPSIGSWKADGQTAIQHTPDCIVTINGYTEIPGCPSCNGRIDLQQYITTVSVEPTLSPPASATISLFIPSVDNQFFARDGDFLLQPGLEVRIYMRGFFAQRFLTKEDAARQGIKDLDPSKYAVYPYYHVFHGVVTDVSHEYSNGEYTASLTCSDTLHFWNNLKISTNGSVFGVRPDNSLVDPTLIGHTFREATPYSIIYTLFRAGFGAAGGVEFSLDKQTNVAAASATIGKSLYKAAALYWETRWSSRTMNLKMYGADGTLYNSFVQAALSGQTEGLLGNKTAELQAKIASQRRGKDRKPFDTTTDPAILSLIRSLGYNPLSTRIALVSSSDGTKSTGIDVTKMQAFTLDLAALGNVNMFETEYASKMEIAQAVTGITGFEFYQDVDGGIVFKPPFYNLDTSTDPVYVIEDSSLISLGESIKEPEATMMKVKGSSYQPNVDMGLDAWILPTAIFIDYRLVAQFGWRDQTFEAHYLTDTRSLYITAINRLDLINVSTKSANISIPLRPELRPGYPIYIRSIDSYYYIMSLSHSFTPNGNCTTTIQGVAKRSKFNAPGVPPGTREPNVGDIRLDDLYLPAVPLYLKTQNYGEVNRGSARFQAQQEAASGPLRHQGFPNVVMAIGAETVNISSTFDVTASDPGSIIQTALDAGILTVSPTATGDTDQQKRETGPYVVLAGNETKQGKEFTRRQLIDCFDENTRTVDPTSALGVVIQAVKTTITYGGATQNYLNLLKNNRASFAPGTGVTAEYRYYSCSHPSPAHQGVTGVDLTVGEDARFSIPAGASPQGKAQGFLANGGYGEVSVRKGIPISYEEVAANGSVRTEVKSVSTKDIYSVSFMRNYTTRSIPTSKTVLSNLANLGRLIHSVKDIIQVILSGGTNIPGDTMSDRMGIRYRIVYNVLDKFNPFSGLPNNYDSLTGMPSGNPDKIVTDPFATLEQNITDNGLLDAGVTYNDDTWFRKYVKNISAYMWSETMIPSFSLIRLLQQQYTANPYDVNANTQADDLRKEVNELIEALNKISPSSVEASSVADDIFVSSFALEKDPRADFTPVYPVSDANGYEVYGVFPYGRGLTVSTFLDMMQTEGSFFGNLTTSTSLAAIEAFLSAYRDNGGDIGKAISSVDPILKLELYAAVSSADQAVADDGSFIAQVKLQQSLGNSPENQNKVLASNIPVQLAEITVGEDQLCSCKTFDSQIYLLAASLDPATYRPISALWQKNKDAYAGVNIDNRARNLSFYFDPFRRDSSRFFANPAAQEVQNAADALGDAVDSAQAVRDAARRLFRPNGGGNDGNGG